MYRITSRNWSLLRERCGEAVKALLDLYCEAYEVLALLWPREEVRDEALKGLLMYPMFMHVVIPNIGYVPFALMQGALPQAHFSLRLAIESMICAVHADCRDEYRALDLARKIEESGVRSVTSIRDEGVRGFFLKLLSDAFGGELSQQYLDMISWVYQKLSTWAHPLATLKLGEAKHPAGLLVETMLSFAKHGSPPSYAWLLPTELSDEDLDDVRELGAIAKYVRLAILVLAYTWLHHVGVGEDGSLKALGELVQEAHREV